MTKQDRTNEEALWMQFAAPLRAFIARRVPVGIEPDDVVQEVFLRVLRHMSTLRDSDRIEAWLYQVTRNAINDALRVRQRRDLRNDPLELDVADEGHAPPTRDAEAELAPCLRPMIARLAEPYRTAIELTSHAGLTQTEAARRLGVSVSGMKSRVQRGREQLKRMLVQCCDVQVDRRGGVSDYTLQRSSGTCGHSAGSAADGACEAHVCSDA